MRGIWTATAFMYKAFRVRGECAVRATESASIGNGNFKAGRVATESAGIAVMFLNNLVGDPQSPSLERTRSH